ncbi:B/F/G family RNA polymerase sigma-70 factor [Streptacidiphilus pinicola]|uniref:B/F/G family RNA polymerase sigma-70 factor n=1 Tax=Streptacidiphilus pinicola TaxID=2219663 RepID=A0A2X0K067_9ACTN|nr:SigB/SigF/SigG family RNA polymerase sigma factor [Streptacidiphilus pinicola]RAG82635.1 B/F/G family RNA polymerase sigma-70 factor [Streptacidiphilus pinicola]
MPRSRLPATDRDPTGPTEPSDPPVPTVPARLPSPHAVETEDARALSRALFLRLSELEEGTTEYSYVRNTLVELNLALVRYAAGRFRHRTEPAEDLLQVGIVGLIKAINRFDPAREVEFSTFALPTIAGELKRHFRDTSWSVRVPRRLQELRLRLAKATEELEQELEHEPTDVELAEHLHVSPEEIAEGRVAGNAYTAGTLEPPDETEAEGPQGRRLGYLDPALDEVEDVETLRPLIAALPERERTILALRFTGELTQAEIGARLGISQMHVSRILSRVLADLRAALLADE